MDVTNKIDSISSIIKFTVSISFLYLGWGIKGLALSGGISCIITSTLYIYASKRVAPYLAFNPLLFNYKTLKEIWGFSMYSAMSNAVLLVQLQLDKLIINYFVGVKYLALYDIAYRLAFFVWGLCGSFAAPIMPAMSNIYACEGIDKLKDVFQVIYKYTSLIICPLFLFVSFFANKLIVSWLGIGYENAIPVLRILSIAYMLSLLSGYGGTILTGMGLYKSPFYAGCIAALATALFCSMLTIYFNILGCAIGIMIAYILANIVIFIQLQKVFDTTFVVRTLYNSLRLPVVLSTFIFFITNMLIGSFFGNKYIELILSCISLLIVYGLVIYKCGSYRAFWESINTLRI